MDVRYLQNIYFTTLNDMDKKLIGATLLISIIIILLGMFLNGSDGSADTPGTTQDEISESTASEVTFANVPQEDVIFYYGITCPHCQEVEKYIQDNNIEEDLTIIKKEIYRNRDNSTELTQAAGSCGMNTSQLGVPFLYSEGKCFMGKPDVISEIQRKADLNSNDGQ